MNQSTQTISASNARSNLYTLLDDVSKRLKRVTITHRGNAQAVLMHPDEVAAWEETMDVIANKQLVADILQSKKNQNKGDVIAENELLNELGIIQDELTP